VETAVTMHVNVDKPTENTEYSLSRWAGGHLGRRKVLSVARGSAEPNEAKYYLQRLLRIFADEDAGPG
jgi:hypothetical protein